MKGNPEGWAGAGWGEKVGEGAESATSATVVHCRHRLRRDRSNTEQLITGALQAKKMRLNENTCVLGKSVILVPYKEHHVPK